jgi:hypothetical protein
MLKTTPEQNKALVLEAFDTLFNKRDYAAAERFWSPDHDNLAAARGSREDNDSLAGLIVTFVSGICLEQNLGPDRARITRKIDAFMRLIRAI